MSRALAIVTLLAACGPNVALPDQTTTSRWVRYHHWEDEVPCPEVLEQLDGQIDFMTKTFGLDVKPVDYFKWRETEMGESAKACQRFGSVACTVGAVSYGVGWAESHEIVHAVWDQLGYPPQMFIEGIAVVLGCGETGYAGLPIPLDLDVESLMATNVWNASFKTNGAWNYAIAGSFVRWLIERSGPRAFVDFYSTAPGAGGGEAHAAFEKVYGLTFADAVAAWRASGPGPEGSFCMSPNDPCDAPPMLDAAAGKTSLTRRLSCVPQVITVAAADGEAVAAALSSSERPITAVLEACVPQSRFEPVVTPPELVGRPPSTVGKDLELRSFGLGAKGRLRVTPARSDDRLGAMLDPQGSAFGGAWGGELTARTLPSAGALFSSSCPAEPILVGEKTWAVQLTGDVESMAGARTSLTLRSPSPFRVRSVRSNNVQVETVLCGGACGNSCENWLGADHSLTLVPLMASGRFRVHVVLER
ncbi:MAG: hypothetical protein JNK82_28395 [Myxococcaceae bacterium]|nr:hypothetical protein [Myxococcaceae bacterium]